MHANDVLQSALTGSMSASTGRIKDGEKDNNHIVLGNMTSFLQKWQKNK